MRRGTQPPPRGDNVSHVWDRVTASGSRVIAGLFEYPATDRRALFPGHDFISPHAGISGHGWEEPWVFCQVPLDALRFGLQKVA